MTQRLNVRLLISLLAGALLAATLCVLIHEMQMRRNAGAMLRQAEYALARHEFAYADQNLQRYLSYERDTGAALAGYGLALKKHAKTPSQRAAVYEILERVLQAEPQRNDIRYELVYAALSLYRLDAAIEHAMKLLPNWPNKAELHHVIGWCHDARRDFEKAAAAFRQSIAADPTRVSAYLLLAMILEERLSLPDEAEQVLNDLVARNGESSGSFLARARLHLRHGNIEQAEQDIAVARKLAPQDVDALLMHVAVLRAQNKLTAARDLAGKAFAEQPHNVRICKELASLQLRLSNKNAAMDAIQQGLRCAPNDTDLLLALADLHVEHKNLGEAKQALSKIRDQKSPEVQYVEARIAFAKDEWQNAADALEKLRLRAHGDAELASRVNTLLGLCYERLHRSDKQIVALQRTVAEEPESSSARIGLATALLAEERVEQAIAALELMKSRPDFPPSGFVLLARAHILKNLRRPETQRDWVTVDALLLLAAGRSADAAEIAVLRAEVLAAQKKIGEARTLLQAALAGNRDSALLWCALADLAGRERKTDDGLKLLDEAARQLGDRADLRLAGGRLLIAHPEPDARHRFAALAADIDRLPPHDRERLLSGLAVLARESGDLDQAATLWRQLAEMAPRDLRSRGELLDLAVSAQRTNEAKSLLEEMRRIDGRDSVFCIYGQAALAIQEAEALQGKERTDKLAAAAAGLIEAARHRPNWPQLLLLQARAAELEGDVESAIGRYLHALEQGERRLDLVHKVLHVLYQRRRFVEADRVLRQLEQHGPLSPQLARLGAEIALGNRDAPHGCYRARQAVSERTHDYRALLWQADIFIRAGANVDAEAALRRAVAVGGHAPDTWIALVRHLARTEQRPAIPFELDEMKKQITPPLLPATLARCQEAAGNVDRALQQFDRALITAPRDFIAHLQAAEFYLRAEAADRAEQCLRSLIDPQMDTPGVEAAWARRELAVLLAERGARAEALALLDTNRKLGGERSADEHARLFVQGLQPGQRGTAIHGLTQSLSQAPATKQERFWLMRLCEEAGQADKARELLLDLLLTDPEDASLLAHQVRRFLAMQQLGDAQIYLNRLQRLEPSSARAKRLASQLARAKAAFTP